VYRIGQKRLVKVFQLVAQNTVEGAPQLSSSLRSMLMPDFRSLLPTSPPDKVLEIQERKQLLIQQAFSGTKNGGEMSKQKKQGRIDDLRELFA
jgi:SWI/SNF-related matrix-associated actin-dependent regulator of chromatin subfamily A3